MTAISAEMQQLVDDGLIEAGEDGVYRLTDRGRARAEQIVDALGLPRREELT